MANPTVLEGDVFVAGHLSAREFKAPDGSIDNDALAAAAAIATSKQKHRHPVRYAQPDGTDIAAEPGVPVHIVRGTTATLVAVEVVCLDSNEGGDKGFTVDVRKCNAASPTPATVMTSVITFAAGVVADCEIAAGTIATAAFVDGDTAVIVIAVSGTTGNQGQGLAVILWFDEDPA